MGLQLHSKTEHVANFDNSCGHAADMTEVEAAAWSPSVQHSASGAPGEAIHASANESPAVQGADKASTNSVQEVSLHAIW